LLSAFILFVSTGLFVYWFTRMLMLLRGPQEEFDDAVATDLWWARRLLVYLRSILGPPTTFAS